jgi:hypothetical protein
MNNEELRERTSDMILSELKLSDLKMLAQSFEGKSGAYVKKICQEIIKRIDWSEEQRLKEKLEQPIA